MHLWDFLKDVKQRLLPGLLQRDAWRVRVWPAEHHVRAAAEAAQRGWRRCANFKLLGKKKDLSTIVNSYLTLKPTVASCSPLISHQRRAGQPLLVSINQMTVSLCSFQWTREWMEDQVWDTDGAEWTAGETDVTHSWETGGPAWKPYG